MINPFVFDRPLKDEPLIDREEELQELVRRFDNGINTRLVSPRDYGKTSLLYRLFGALERADFGTVLVDLYGVTTLEQLAHRIDDAYSSISDGRIARTVAAVRRRGGGGGLSTPVGGGSARIGGESSSERLLIDSLKLPEKVFERTGRRQLVAFDEFQEVLAAGLDGSMRSVIQHQGDSVTYIFSGSHPGMMRELFADRRRPFYNQASPLKIGRFPDQAIADYVGQHFEATGRNADPVMESFLELVEGHPQRTMLAAHLLWERTELRDTADETTLAAAMLDAGRFVEEEFRAIWDRSSSLERGVLQAIAWDQQGLRSRAVRERFGLPAGSSGATAAKRLTTIGLLIEQRTEGAGSPGVRYQIDDPFFSRWIRNGRRWAAATE